MPNGEEMLTGNASDPVGSPIVDAASPEPFSLLHAPAVSTAAIVNASPAVRKFVPRRSMDAPVNCCAIIRTSDEASLTWACCGKSAVFAGSAGQYGRGVTTRLLCSV